MDPDADPLLPPHWLAELADGLGGPVLQTLWQHHPPDPIASAPEGSDLQVHWRHGEPPRLVVPPLALRMGGRLHPLLQVGVMASSLLRRRQPEGSLLIQLHDEDPGPGSLRMDAPQNSATPQHGVIPDAYCLGSHGFLLLRQQWAAQPLPPWRQRKPIAIWRGASTDAKAIRVNTLEQSRRYQLCRLSARWPQWLDARFSSVVQCASTADSKAVQQHLRQLGLLAPRLEPTAMAQCRWLLDLDGNVNSWGLLWKLLSGSCVLRIRSDRSQWFHHRLVPGRHLLEVKSDLSDLDATLHWCQSQPEQCEAIAHEGRTLALQVLEDLGADLLTAIRAVAA